MEIDSELIDQEIERTNEIIKEEEAWSQTYIYVNTDFKRNNEPIFAFASMEGERRLRPKKEHFLFKSDEYVLKKVSEAVQSHYRNNNGELPRWGKIINYAYRHRDGKVYVFDPSGKIIDEEVHETKATLSIK